LKSFIESISSLVYPHRSVPAPTQKPGPTLPISSIQPGIQQNTTPTYPPITIHGLSRNDTPLNDPTSHNSEWSPSALFTRYPTLSNLGLRIGLGTVVSSALYPIETVAARMIKGEPLKDAVSRNPLTGLKLALVGRVVSRTTVFGTMSTVNPVVTGFIKENTSLPEKWIHYSGTLISSGIAAATESLLLNAWEQKNLIIQTQAPGHKSSISSVLKSIASDPKSMVRGYPLIFARNFLSAGSGFFSMAIITSNLSESTRNTPEAKFAVPVVAGAIAGMSTGSIASNFQNFANGQKLTPFFSRPTAIASLSRASVLAAVYATMNLGVEKAKDSILGSDKA